jgi:hypothetical protein
MTPELLNVIDDAIKILGPALITGFVGYFSASIQFTTRLKELDKNNEFKAREHFYKFYKEQRISSGEAAQQSLQTLSTLLLAVESGDLNEANRSKLHLIHSQMPASREAFKQGMEYWKLTDTYQYKQLLEAYEKVKTLDYTEQPTTDHIKALIDLVAITDLCADKIDNEKMNLMFGKYFTK